MNSRTLYKLNKSSLKKTYNPLNAAFFHLQKHVYFLIAILRKVNKVRITIFYKIFYQGCPQDLGGGGKNYFFSDLGICMSH